MVALKSFYFFIFWASKSNVRKKGVFANRLKHSRWCMIINHSYIKPITTLNLRVNEYLRFFVQEMMRLLFILVLLQCYVVTEGAEINIDERSLSTECLSTQTKTIIIYLDFQKTTLEFRKFDLVANILQYLVEMLLKRSTCFKLFMFSPLRGAIVELTKSVVILSFLDHEIFSAIPQRWFFNLVRSNSAHRRPKTYFVLCQSEV